MKKMLFALLMLLSVGAKAENLSFDFGSFTFIAPLQVVNVTQMYSFEDEHGFTGAQTPIVSRGNVDLTIGAATGYSAGVQFPFIGLQTRLGMPFDTSNNALKFGVFVGRDYDAKDTKLGLLASIPLW